MAVSSWYADCADTAPTPFAHSTCKSRGHWCSAAKQILQYIANGGGGEGTKGARDEHRVHPGNGGIKTSCIEDSLGIKCGGDRVQGRRDAWISP